MTFSGWVDKWINQITHVGWGAFLLLAVARHVHLWIAVLTVTGFAALKEGVFDNLVKDPGVVHPGWLDFSFWVAGIGLGVVTWLI
jgi:hypothetical protein